MSVQTVAEQLVAYCREGKHMDAIAELYGEGIVSKESPGAPNEVTTGKEAVTKKSADWLANVEEFHSGEVSAPIVAGQHFTCSMNFDVTFKDRGRQQMEEVCVYEVKDDKIVAEQFFYSMG